MEGSNIRCIFTYQEDNYIHEYKVDRLYVYDMVSSLRYFKSPPNCSVCNKSFSTSTVHRLEPVREPKYIVNKYTFKLHMGCSIYSQKVEVFPTNIAFCSANCAEVQLLCKPETVIH